MANTTNIAGRTLTILLDGSTDWSWDSSTEIAAAPELDELSEGGYLYLHSISFDPVQQADAVKVREVSLSGPIFYNRSGVDAYDQRTKLFHDKGYRGIFIANGDVTSTGGGAILTIILA